MSKSTNQLTTCADYAAKLADDLLTPATAAKEYAASLELTEAAWSAYQANPASIDSEEAILLFQRKTSLENLVAMFDDRKIESLQYSIREKAYVSQVEGRVAALTLALAAKTAPRGTFIETLKGYLVDVAARFYDAGTTPAQRVQFINERDAREEIAIAADAQIADAQGKIKNFKNQPCLESYAWAEGSISLISFT